MGGNDGSERGPSQSQRDSAYARSGSSHPIAGLYTSFHSAASVVRIADALGELDPTVASTPEALRSFLERINDVERRLYDRPDPSSTPPPFVIAVEGLDGSGKTTLVRNLSSTLGYRAVSTPPTSVDAVRPVFDKRGGAVARAFYMVGNYILQDEIRWNGRGGEGGDVRRGYVVDRFYGTTCAYTVGWKNTSGKGSTSVDTLDELIFEWPSKDLDPPQLMLVLDVTDDVRRKRVEHRASTTEYNPWDGRLSNDSDLGDRISAAYRRVSAPGMETVLVNADGTPDDVCREAADAAKIRIRSCSAPWEGFERDPVGFFVETSRGLGLCDADGRRGRHAPWSMHIALNGAAPGSPPSLRSVGIHTADRAGYLFFVRGHPGGGFGGQGGTDAASMCWVGGDYPHEQQWRAEGVMVPTTLGECQLMGTAPPASLVAQMSACVVDEEQEEVATGTKKKRQGDAKHGGGRRSAAPVGHAKLAAELRASPLPPAKLETIVLPARFVPLRMEVLIGGPSSPDGPRRYEWRRSIGDVKEKAEEGWEQARPILPFSFPGAIPNPTLKLRPVVIAITGTHCAGKRTVGERVAEALGWIFEPELGDVLRDREELVADGHRVGDGTAMATSKEKQSDWDERIHAEECRRDRRAAKDEEGNRSPKCRVTETWHLGNLAWALQRGNCDHDPEAQARLVSRARDAVKDEIESRSLVLFVHLDISPETSVRRRRHCADGDNSARLPMADESTECARLHRTLHSVVLDLLRSDWMDEMRVPLLVLKNDQDGGDAVEDAARSIVGFVNLNHWRRAL